MADIALIAKAIVVAAGNVELAGSCCILKPRQLLREYKAGRVFRNAAVQNIAEMNDAVKMRLRIDRADVFVRMIREIRHSRSRKQREAEIVRLPERMELFCQRPAIVRKMWFHMDASIYI